MSSYGDSLKAKTFNCSTITCSVDLQAPAAFTVKAVAAQPANTTVGHVGQVKFCTALNANGGGIWICTAVTGTGDDTTYTWLQLSSAVDPSGGA